MDWAISSYRCLEETGDVIDHGWACQHRRYTVERVPYGNGIWALTARRITPRYIGTWAAVSSQAVGLELSPSSPAPGEPFLVNNLVDMTWDGGQRIKCKVTAVGQDWVTLSGGSGSAFPPGGTSVTVRLRDFSGLNLGKNDCLVPSVKRLDGFEWGTECHDLTLAGIFKRTSSGKQPREYLWSKGELSAAGKCVYLVSCEGLLNPNRIRFTLYYQTGYPVMSDASIFVDVPTSNLPVAAVFGVAVVFTKSCVQLHVAIDTGLTFSLASPRVPHHPVPDKKTVLGSRAGNEGWTGLILGWCASGFEWSPVDLKNYVQSHQPPIDVVSRTPGSAIARMSAVMVDEASMPDTSIYWPRPIIVGESEARWYWSSDHGGSEGAVAGIYTGVSVGPEEFPPVRDLFIANAETPHFCDDPRVPFPLIAHEVLPNWAGWEQYRQGSDPGQMSFFYDSAGARQLPAVPFASCAVPMEFPNYTHTGYVETAVTSLGELVAFGSGMSGTQYGAVKSRWSGSQFVINPESPQLNPWDGMQQGMQVEWWRNQFARGARRFGVGRCRVGDNGIYHYSAAIVELCPETLLPIHPVSVIVLRDHIGVPLGVVDDGLSPDINTNLNYVQDVSAFYLAETSMLYVYVLHGMRKVSGRSMLRVHRFDVAAVLDGPLL